MKISGKSYSNAAINLSECLKFNNELLSQRQIYEVIFRLCIPAILMQIASFAMQYIDATMVGSLGLLLQLLC